MPMAPGYISLAYLIDFRMIKLYLLPILLTMYGSGSNSLLSPVTYVMHKNLPILFDILTIATNGKPFKVNLLNDDTYRYDSVTIIMSSFGQIDQGAH